MESRSGCRGRRWPGSRSGVYPLVAPVLWAARSWRDSTRSITYWAERQSSRATRCRGAGAGGRGGKSLPRAIERGDGNTGRMGRACPEPSSEGTRNRGKLLDGIIGAGDRTLDVELDDLTRLNHEQ